MLSCSPHCCAAVLLCCSLPCWVFWPARLHNSMRAKHVPTRQCRFMQELPSGQDISQGSSDLQHHH